MDRTKNNLKTDRKTDGYEPIFTSVPSILLIPVYMFPLLFKLQQNLNLTSDSSRKGVGSNGGTCRKSCFLILFLSDCNVQITMCLSVLCIFCRNRALIILCKAPVYDS